MADALTPPDTADTARQPAGRADELRARVESFVRERVLPAEATYRRQVAQSGDPHHHPQVMEELKAQARAEGLWNLFLADSRFGAGLTNREYAPLAEAMGWSLIAPEVFNCSAPDTGNMEILALFGTERQRDSWLRPLLDGEIRSCFAMTEPGVASSDATNIRARIERDGDDYVVTARKWWTTGAAGPRCKFAIVMGRSGSGSDPYRDQSMLIVPMDAPGVSVERTLSVFGYDEYTGHGEVVFDRVRVSSSNLLGSEGDGFAVAQSRLGPGRIHHCMRSIGAAERAFSLMCARADQRVAFGRPLADQGVVQQWIARSRINIDQGRLLVLNAAELIDREGIHGARSAVSAIKAAIPRLACEVVDRAIQLHGAAGMSQDFPLAEIYAHLRTMRIVDGPDEVHLRALARSELRRMRELRLRAANPEAT